MSGILIIPSIRVYLKCQVYPKFRVIIQVTRYLMISRTEPGQVGYRKICRVAGEYRIPVGSWLGVVVGPVLGAHSAYSMFALRLRPGRGGGQLWDLALLVFVIIVKAFEPKPNVSERSCPLIMWKVSSLKNPISLPNVDTHRDHSQPLSQLSMDRSPPQWCSNTDLRSCQFTMLWNRRTTFLDYIYKTEP